MTNQPANCDIEMTLEGKAIERLRELTPDVLITTPKECLGLKRSHASVVYEDGHLRMTLEGPILAVLAAIQAARNLCF